jgi:alkanesulfonate monooxygenase
VALVGGTNEIFEVIFEYCAVGVTEFLFTGFPDLDQMRFFGEEILPRVRERERLKVPGPQGT